MSIDTVVLCNSCNQPIADLDSAWYGRLNRFECGFEHRECHCEVILDDDYSEDF